MKNPSGRIARWIEVLSGYEFEVQYRQASRHQNADSMSRCPNPKDCSCPDTDNEETLKCGPCKKCLKRAEQVDSTLLKVECGTSETENVISPQVSRCSDNCYLPENVKRGVLGLLASVTKHAVLLIMIFTFLFLITSDGTLLLPQLALCCGTCFALVITVKNSQSPICTIGAVLVCYFNALLLRGVECTGTFTDAMQIFKRKIWSFCISVTKDLRSFALMTGQQCLSVTTRSRSEVHENLLPWSDGYSSDDLRDMQEKDINIGAIVSWLSSGSKI